MHDITKKGFIYGAIIFVVISGAGFRHSSRVINDVVTSSCKLCQDLRSVKVLNSQTKLGIPAYFVSTKTAPEEDVYYKHKENIISFHPQYLAIDLGISFALGFLVSSLKKK